MALEVRRVRRSTVLHDETGTVTAEFVVVIPAVLAVIALAVGAVLLSAHRVVLTSAAAEIARLEARGDTGAAHERIGSLGEGVAVARSTEGALYCVALSARPAAGLLAVVEVSARGCAVRSEAGSATG